MTNNSLPDEGSARALVNYSNLVHRVECEIFLPPGNVTKVPVQKLANGLS